MNQCLLLAVCVGSGLFAMGCRSTPSMVPLDDAEISALSLVSDLPMAEITTPASQPSTVSDRASTPVLVPGLILNIRVLVDGEVEIEAEEKRVRAGGDIILPLLGRVDVAGLTLDELAALLYKLYDAKYFVDPSVVVDFVAEKGAHGISPWGYVTVLGCVNSPGRVNIPPTRDLRVSQAIQQVNGCDEGARPGAIRVTRKHRGGKLERIKVDLHDVGSKGELEQDVILRAGDVVFVPESFF